MEWLNNNYLMSDTEQEVEEEGELVVDEEEEKEEEGGDSDLESLPEVERPTRKAAPDFIRGKKPFIFKQIKSSPLFSKMQMVYY